MKSEKRVAVVTGANRGIGLETVKQLALQGFLVVLTSRDSEKGQKAAAPLEGEIVVHPVDVRDRASVERLGSFLRERVGRLDVLVNNAGIVREPYGQSFFDASAAVVQETLDTNLFGAFHCCQVLIPLMKEAGYGRVINVSSGMGQLTEVNAGATGYRLSKTALNALTRLLAAELEGTDVKVNAVCPGWVRTDLGGPNATRPVEDAVDTILWLASLRKDGPSGGFFRDCKAIPW
jgi:NAD(P)-dependent dehydrogenase (short-subunit alcohol dehydrogenase family)